MECLWQARIKNQRASLPEGSRDRPNARAAVVLEIRHRVGKGERHAGQDPQPDHAPQCHRSGAGGTPPRIHRHQRNPGREWHPGQRRALQPQVVEEPVREPDDASHQGGRAH